jgi:hypothetical protein
LLWPQIIACVLQSDFDRRQRRYICNAPPLGRCPADMVPPRFGIIANAFQHDDVFIFALVKVQRRAVAGA